MDGAARKRKAGLRRLARAWDKEVAVTLTQPQILKSRAGRMQLTGIQPEA